MAHQSLYRSYRPQRFSEVRGQDHVVRALRNAVREDRVGHAYLFSGPRGTGKTSTARILAKALNCEDLQDGEPDGTCASCQAIEAGTSYDLQELDAASNNGVEAVRDLIGKVALGSPGRTKVYILDEVHMLSTAASNALLKTLEEPPPHVVFVLATTDPHKVLPTIRSRTQHYEFHLIPADILAEHVAWVAHDAGLEVDQDAVDYVLRQGGGSARDTLSALDQVVAAGGVLEPGEPLDALFDAIVEADTAAALVAVAEAVSAGRDPRVLGEALLARLRDVFLVRMRAGVDHLPDAEQERIRAWAERFGDRATTRALELVGDALLEMRQAPDARIPLEVALVKITQPKADDSIGSLIERLERVEQALAGGVSPAPAATAPRAGEREAAPPDPAVTDPSATGAVAHEPAGGTGPAGARAALAAGRGASGGRPSPPPPPRRPGASARSAEPDAPPASAGPPAGSSTSEPSRAAEPDAGSSTSEPTMSAEPDAGSSTSEPTGSAEPAVPDPAAVPPSERSVAGGDATSGVGGLVSADEALTLDRLAAAWTQVMQGFKPVVRGRFADGEVVSIVDGTATFAVRSQIMRGKCAERAAEVEAALAAALGQPIRLEVVVAGAAGPPGAETGPAAGPRPASPSAGPSEDEVVEVGDVDELEDAPDAPVSRVDALQEAFPGAKLVEDDA